VAQVTPFQTGFEVDDSQLTPGAIFRKNDGSLWEVLPDGSHQPLGNGGSQSAEFLGTVKPTVQELIDLGVLTAPGTWQAETNYLSPQPITDWYSPSFLIANGKLWTAEDLNSAPLRQTGTEEPDWASVSVVGDSIVDGDYTWYLLGDSSLWPPTPADWAAGQDYDTGFAAVWPDSSPFGVILVRYPGYVFGELSSEPPPDWFSALDSGYPVDQIGGGFWIILAAANDVVSQRRIALGPDLLTQVLRSPGDEVSINKRPIFLTATDWALTADTSAIHTTSTTSPHSIHSDDADKRAVQLTSSEGSVAIHVGNGDPTGQILPTAGIGSLYLDKTAGQVWVATGAADTDWAQLATV